MSVRNPYDRRRDSRDGDARGWDFQAWGPVRRESPITVLQNFLLQDFRAFE